MTNTTLPSLEEYDVVTVKLIREASQALDHASELTGHNKTDTINRALQIYNFIMTEMNDGNEFVITDGKSSSRLKIT